MAIDTQNISTKLSAISLIAIATATGGALAGRMITNLTAAAGASITLHGFAAYTITTVALKLLLPKDYQGGSLSKILNNFAYIKTTGSMLSQYGVTSLSTRLGFHAITALPFIALIFAATFLLDPEKSGIPNSGPQQDKPQTT